MGAKSYILEQFNNNFQNSVDKGLSAINLLIDTQVKNNKDHFTTQIQESLEHNVYNNPNTDDWESLSTEVFSNVEKNIDSLSISDEAKYRLKRDVVDYAKSNFNATLNTRIEQANLYKLKNELTNTMKLDASNSNLSITEAYNNYLDSYMKSNELASNHGLELTKPEEYLDILVSAKSSQYIDNLISEVPNNFLDEKGIAITPEKLVNQTIDDLTKELTSLSADSDKFITNNTLNNIKSLVSQAYNQKMQELTLNANNTKKALLGEISNSKGLYDVDKIKIYFTSNYPQFIVDTVGNDLIEIADYKNDQLFISEWKKNDDYLSQITQDDLNNIMTPEVKEAITLDVASSQIMNLLNSDKYEFNDDEELYELLNINLSTDEKSKLEKNIVELITPGQYKSSTINPILTAVNNVINDSESNKLIETSENNIIADTSNNNQTNIQIKQALESYRLNPFVSDEELDQTIFKFVKSGNLTIEEAISYSNRPNFIDGVSTEIEKNIENIYETNYLNKEFTESEKNSIINSLREGAFQIYENMKPETPQEWENFYTNINTLAKKETVNTFAKEMKKVGNILNDNDFLKTFESERLNDVLTSYSQGDLDFFINSNQLDLLLLNMGAFDLNQDEYSSVDNLQKVILKEFYDSQEFEDLNRIDQLNVKATATIAYATRQERQLVNEYFETDFIEPQKVGNRYVYKLRDSLYVMPFSYEDETIVNKGKADFLMITPKGAKLSTDDLVLNNITNRLVTLDYKNTFKGSEKERIKILSDLKESNKVIQESKPKPSKDVVVDNPSTYMIDKNGQKVNLKPDVGNNLVEQFKFENNLELEKEIERNNSLFKKGKELQNNIKKQAQLIKSESEYLLYNRMGVKKNVLM